ncbi:MAG: helix-turn-helix transcriptional regulator [Phycisphaerales bacterium]|jgi:DNA-binding transcriptional regulator YiaG|nr:helix-turn-helix transcriptional regulator [Phycisphaerales bacterium]MBT7171364.1 helix-turn-helix transcriptional regulator [Phycisphaerales bacterium]
MANLMKELKNEISRLARKEAKQIELTLKKEIAVLRKRLSVTQKRLAEVEQVKKVVAKLPTAPVPVASEEEIALRRMRVTGTMIKKMREKKKLSQGQLAKAMGVSLQSVYQWERKGDTSLKKMRMSVRKALAEVRGLSTRQILKMIEAQTPAKPAKKTAKKKPAKTAAKKVGKKKAAKKKVKKVKKIKTTKRPAKKK